MKRLICLIPLFFLLTGCWDYDEVTMQEYVLGIGVDLTENNEYLVTIETADLSGSPESTGGSRLLQTTGANLFDAIRNAIPHAGKKLYWGHCGLIIVHEDVRGPQLHEVLDVFNRVQDVYLNTSLAVARGVAAQDIFHANYGGSDSITAHIANIFQNQDSSRRFRKTELWQYTRDWALYDCVMLPTVSLVNEMPSLSGGAIYRGTEFLTFLSGDEVLLHSLLTEEISGGWLPEIMLPSGKATSFEILSNHTKVTQNTLSPTLTLSLSSANASLDVKTKQQRTELESVIANSFQQQFSHFVSRAQTEGFASLLRLSDSTPISIFTTVRLHNTGMYYNQPEDAS